MATVVMTGGTGALGRHLVPELLSRGHELRVLSRSPSGMAGSASTFPGDVRTGAGLSAACHRADVVIHAATSPLRHMRSTEIDGTHNAIEVARAAAVPHVIYVSIVGVDQFPHFPYYRTKAEAEQVVRTRSVGWTIQRVTQFHSLLDKMLRFGLFPTTPNLAFQPIAERDASVRLADLVEDGASGRVPDIGGPEVLPIRALRDVRQEITGRRAILIRLPRVSALRDLDEGHHLAPANVYGRTTWAEWLSESAWPGRGTRPDLGGPPGA